MRGPGLPEMVRDGMHAEQIEEMVRDAMLLWAPRAEQIEEIVDLSGGDPRRSSISSRRARRVTAGDARVLSMASEWVSIRAHQSPSEPIRAWRLNGFQATRLVRSGAEVGIELRRV
jgi:hypothetical protein